MLGRDVMLLIKAPWIKLNLKRIGVNDFTGEITAIEQNEVLVKIGHTVLCAIIEEPISEKVGESVQLHIDPEQIILATL